MRTATAFIVPWTLGLLGTASCEVAGPRHDPIENTSSPALQKVAEGSSATESARGLEPVAATRTAPERCVVPRVEPAPPVAPAAANCPPDPAAPLALAIGRVRFAQAPAAPTVSVERAVDDAARTRGLMYRTELGADAGMLFSWSREEPRSFWMLNTCIPLDMLFIAADGTIVGILEQVPTLNTLPRGVPCPAQHVLELNAGWARQHGVEPGQKVEFET